ncbi:spondin domain-containing protein [Pseudoalteromonas xiamenensis]|nr:spondin domain-containing protein [Pseudoalteromonas xiamenensis]WMN60898.1 spondin domain-containing protein [Pseudoalteromonas xiamenensis]
MNKATSALITGLSFLASSQVMAASVEVKITNLTQGIYFTPLLVAAHSGDSHLYQVGSKATLQLQAMAEGGDISGLAAELSSINASTAANPAEGLLAPTASTMAMVESSEINSTLSLVAMMLPTNDGFVGLDAWPIPTQAGTYHIYLNAYDAGTEANNELIVEGSGAPGSLGIPASPGMAPGTQGSGVTSEEANMMVHIHRGNLGDDEATGGKSDLHNTVHRWLNPVAKVTVTVK